MYVGNTPEIKIGSRRTLRLHNGHKEKCIVDFVVLGGLCDLHQSSHGLRVTLVPVITVVHELPRIYLCRS